MSAALVERDRIVFPLGKASQIREISPGDIVVSGYDFGFIRRVISSSQNSTSIVLETVGAALLDAVFVGDLRADIPLVVNESFSGAELYATGSGRIWLEQAHVTTNAILRLNMRIRNGKLEKFEAVIDGDLVSELQSRASFTGLTKIPSIAIPILSIPIRKYYAAIGPMPVVLSLSVKIRAGVEAELDGDLNVSLGGRVNTSSDGAGIVRNGESWQFVGQHATEVSYHGPDVSVNGRVKWGVSVSIPIVLGLYVEPFSFAGAAVELEPKAKLQFDGEVRTDPPPAIDSWCAAVVPSLNAGANLKIILPGEQIRRQYSTTLWETAYPFDVGGGGECVLWDDASWDQSVWQ